MEDQSKTAIGKMQNYGILRPIILSCNQYSAYKAKLILSRNTDLRKIDDDSRNI